MDERSKRREVEHEAFLAERANSRFRVYFRKGKDVGWRFDPFHEQNQAVSWLQTLKKAALEHRRDWVCAYAIDTAKTPYVIVAVWVSEQWHYDGRFADRPDFEHDSIVEALQQ